MTRLPSHHYIASGKEYGTNLQVCMCGLTPEQAEARARRKASYGGLDLWGVDKVPTEYATEQTRQELSRFLAHACDARLEAAE